MHAAERERLIMAALGPSGFVSYRELEARIAASPATIRRDLAKLELQGRIERLHGGAKIPDHGDPPRHGTQQHLTGTPFDQAITQHLDEKQSIGRAAAALCRQGEGIMIDGGTTTLQMCPHLAGLDLQVLTNSLHIVNALIPQPGTRILVPSGALFREQNIILAPSGEESMPRFHAPKLFMGAASVGAQGVMQADTVLVAAERRLIEKAEEVILLVDSSKFTVTSGTIVCGLDEVDVIVTGRPVPDAIGDAIRENGVTLIIAD